MDREFNAMGRMVDRELGTAGRTIETAVAQNVNTNTLVSIQSTSYTPILHQNDYLSYHGDFSITTSADYKYHMFPTSIYCMLPV